MIIMCRRRFELSGGVVHRAESAVLEPCGGRLRFKKGASWQLHKRQAALRSPVSERKG
jgi:hypothetical protein